MEAKRVRFEYKAIYYENNLSEKVAVFIAHDHTNQMIREIAKEYIQNYKFFTESISRRIKLAQMDNDKGVLTEYEDWPKFYNKYGKNYPKETSMRKYTRNGNSIRQFVFFETVSQAALGFVLLDMFDARPVFTAKTVALGHVHDLKV